MTTTQFANRSCHVGMMLGMCWLLSACGGGGGGGYSDNSSAASSSASASSSSSSSSASSSSSSSGVLGLDMRPSNTSCLAWARPASNDSISLERAFASLSFAAPIAMLQAPGDGARWFVVQQDGVVRKFDNVSTVSVTNDFIDIVSRVTSGGEMGLLGMAFHPNFPGDPRVFLSYTTGSSSTPVSRISSFTTPDGGLTLDPNSEQILLALNQPESNHNGGNITFGRDGYLYIGFGDGGGGGDTHGSIGNGQNLNTMLGKMLRIDVGSSAATTYSIPTGNPFAGNAKCSATGGSAPCPEIYAWGFRNPWRWSFDKLTGELWVGDVGQGAYEEIDQVELGGNYGWRIREGAHCYNASSCTTAGLIDPVAEYDHTLGNSVTGGYVYRGTQTTSLFGRYLFADFGSGLIWAWLPEQATGPRVPTQILSSGRNISSFGEANNGELYVVDYSGGLYHVNFTGSSSGGTVPSSLADTGCVDSTNPTQAASGLIPYDINAAFWSDGASKERWMALPNGQNIAVESNGDWTFPNGSVLMKNFRVSGLLVETRLLMRHSDGSWSGYTYEWNNAQTAATRVQGGKTRALTGGQVWIYPSESQCLECHTNVAGNSLGLMTAQLNRSYLYASTGRSANQLDTLSGINVLSPSVASGSAPTLVNPSDTTASLDSRARAYLQTNCAQCHQPSGPTPSTMDLRYSTTLAATNTCNVVPTAGDLGLSGARLIAPGNAGSSVLVERVKRRDAHGMPPLASNVVDTDGVSLLTAWVNSLSGC